MRHHSTPQDLTGTPLDPKYGCVELTVRDSSGKVIDEQHNQPINHAKGIADKMNTNPVMKKFMSATISAPHKCDP
jgi:hypothetical protein